VILTPLQVARTTRAYGHIDYASTEYDKMTTASNKFYGSASPSHIQGGRIMTEAVVGAYRNAL